MQYIMHDVIYIIRLSKFSCAKFNSWCKKLFFFTPGSHQRCVWLEHGRRSSAKRSGTVPTSCRRPYPWMSFRIGLEAAQTFIASWRTAAITSASGLCRAQPNQAGQKIARRNTRESRLHFKIKVPFLNKIWKIDKCN